MIKTTMSTDEFQRQFAEAVAAGFVATYSDLYNANPDLAVFRSADIEGLLEKPKDPAMGRFSFPVFRFAKDLKEAPPAIAAKIAKAAEIELSKVADRKVSITATGGFLNARVDFVSLASNTLEEILRLGIDYGKSDIGKNRKYLVEYSSPNIAKPFGVGHLRSTVIGNSLRRIYAKQGFDAVGINFLGDWGTQFGKMIVGFKKWGKAASGNTLTLLLLLELYVRYHNEAKNDPTLDAAARAEFKKLEDGDPEAVQTWRQFKAISLTEFDRVYDRLGVTFNETIGESDLNDKMDATIERLTKAGLTKVSQGALVVEMEDPNLPPCLLKKKDGATLYATRDLAGLEDRWNNHKFYRSLYVVGSAQADHFKQIFNVISQVERVEGRTEDDSMTGKVRHVEFGWVKFGAKTMSTRQGNIIFLEDVIDRAVSLVKERIAEKNPDLADIEATALMVGVGAVTFSQLSVRRQKDVHFIWEDVLSFEGETGPYLQYTHARLCAVMRKYGESVSSEIDFALLEGEEELRVIETLTDFPIAIDSAAENHDPVFIATYLIKLAGTFNRFYQRKDANGRVDRIISDDEQKSAARMALVKSTQIVMNEGLRLLGLQAPEEM